MNTENWQALADLINEKHSLNELGSGYNDIKKAIRGLDELMTNCVSIMKQLPDQGRFRGDIGDYMDAVGLLCAHAQLSKAEKQRCTNDVTDALNAILKMVELKDKIKTAKQTVGNLKYHFETNYPKN